MTTSAGSLHSRVTSHLPICSFLGHPTFPCCSWTLLHGPFVSTIFQLFGLKRLATIFWWWTCYSQTGYEKQTEVLSNRFSLRCACVNSCCLFEGGGPWAGLLFVGCPEVIGTFNMQHELECIVLWRDSSMLFLVWFLFFVDALGV